MMTPRPEECTSKFIFKELNTYVSMRTNQSAWSAHQNHVNNNLRRSMDGKRNTAMPAVDKKDHKGNRSKDGKKGNKTGEANGTNAGQATPWCALPVVKEHRLRAARQRSDKHERSESRSRRRSRSDDRRRSHRSSSKDRDRDGRRDRSKSKDRRSPSRRSGDDRRGREFLHFVSI